MPTKSGRKAAKAASAPAKQAGPVAVNRRASYDYHILETIEAGLVLTGTEIKSIRNGKVDLRGAYARELKRELWLEGMHLAIYEQGNTNNHEPKRPRKLLLHRKQADDWGAQLTQKGLTVLPLRLYIKGRVAKVLLGLAKGKRRYNKKDNLIAREADRDIRRELKGGR
jgi:SsrA-binding protein